MNLREHVEKGRRISLYAAAFSAIALITVCTLLALRSEDAQTSVLPQATVQPTEDAMTAFRTEREQLYAMQKLQLEQLVGEESADSALSGEAQEQLLDLLQRREQEVTIEGILRTRGYSDALATVHEDSVNILLRAPSISEEESAVILELVLRETDVLAENVKIIPII